MDKPVVSVIIAAYNVERYIGRALHSALGQQGVSLEAIVVDDSSTDGTWTIVSANADPRLKRLRLDTNGGPGAARNAAIAMATGGWIAVLDGDDEFSPGRLARCLERARAHDADIVVDNLSVRREADGKVFPMFPPARLARMRQLDLAGFIAGNRLFSPGYSLGYVKPVFSAEFLQKYKLAYDTGIRIGEDYFLLAEALANGAVCAVEPTEGYHYTVRRGSVSHRLSLADIARMSEGDARLVARCHFPPAAARAQKDRENRLRKAYAFTALVEAIKHKDARGAWNAVASCPGCIRLFRLPAGARLRRLLKRLTG